MSSIIISSSNHDSKWKRAKASIEDKISIDLNMTCPPHVSSSLAQSRLKRKLKIDIANPLWGSKEVNEVSLTINWIKLYNQPIFFFWYGSLDFTIDKVFLVTHKSDIEHWDTYVSVSVRQGWGSGASWIEAKIKFEFCIDNGAPVPQFGSINQNITLKCVPYKCEIKGFWIVYNNKALF